MSTSKTFKYCPQCGHPSRLSGRVCTQCGYRFRVSTLRGSTPDLRKAAGTGLKSCLRCQAANKSTAKVCTQCGYRFAAAGSAVSNAAKKSCPQCGHISAQSAKVCSQCGHRFAVPTESAIIQTPTNAVTLPPEFAAPTPLPAAIEPIRATAAPQPDPVLDALAGEPAPDISGDEIDAMNAMKPQDQDLMNMLDPYGRLIISLSRKRP